MNNTLKRTLSGIGFVAVMAAGLLVGKFAYALLLTFMMVTMMAEFYKMTLGTSYRFSRILAILAGEVMFVLLFFRCAYGLPLKFVSFAMLPIFVVMINSLYVPDKKGFWKFSHIYAGILYIASPLALSNLIVFSDRQFSGLLLLCFFILIWASDVGGFVFGLTLGRRFGRKLCPSISPKKSWAGFWGGLFLSLCAAAVLKYTGLLDYSLLHCLILAVIMHLAGVYGDLFESQWKRCYEIKDSGRLIPGHGGMLDRFDSTLFAVPAGVMYLVLFNLI